MGVVMEKTNKKLNELQAQLILVEAQLACAIEINQELQKKLDHPTK